MNNIDYQKELNPEQLDVVLHGDGPCLVLAGAGSGKTRTITYRVAYLLEQGINPEEILLLTFTNKAAKEMLNRVTVLTSPQAPPRKGGVGDALSPPFRGGVGGEVFGGTFHSVAARILRSYAPLVGRSPGFTILDEDDSRSLIKLCLKDAGADGARDKRFPSPQAFQSLYSYSRNAGLNLKEALERRNPAWFSVVPILDHVAEFYENRKHEADAVDFDDLLILFLKLLENNPEVCQRLATRFRYVLVDEFQDTNRLQARLVQKLSSVHRNLLVVGDDAQSIYSFRAAEIKNILDFPKAYPEAKVFRLTANYRSSPEILSLANAIIKNNTNQFKKDLSAIKVTGAKPQVFSSLSVFDDARRIVKEISRLKNSGTSTKEIAVLFRAAFHAQPLEYELMKQGIPYEFRGGMRFFERAHIKDVAAHLRVIANPRDEAAWLRMLGLYPGIGAATASKILIQARSFESLSEALSPNGIAPSRAASGWDLCRGVLVHVLTATQPSEMIRAVVARGYRDYLEAEQPDFKDRLDDLEQFATFAESAVDLKTFLDEVTLAENFSGGQSNFGEKIVLSTIHQAKGLEWDAVFVIGLREGFFPNPRAIVENEIEEERRLFYVAATRAREHLYLTYGINDSRGNELSFSEPSMFLAELPRGVTQTPPTDRALTPTSPQGRGASSGFSPWGRDKREGWQKGSWGDYDEPTIVLNDDGETIKKSKPIRTSFLRDIDEL
ncbi:MAG: ATP-dependent helicase [Candidatus Uhrbacteria bacterium]